MVGYLGKGTFGQVVRCVEASATEDFAIKVIKNKRSYYYQGVVELKVMLKVKLYNAPSPS